MSEAPLLPEGGPVLVYGMAAAGLAVAKALIARGYEVRAADDAALPAARTEAAQALGLEVDVAPDADRLRHLLSGAAALAPTPGLPDRHPVFTAAAAAGAAVTGELDLATGWDSRPCVAITGTNGKTTVTTLVADMLSRSGISTVAAGNNELPLVSAIDDPGPKVFVVEASSFRLGHARSFRPTAGVWLNFAPDHLDVHASVEVYEAAKARLFAHQTPDDVAIVNVDDPVVARHGGAGRRVTFGTDADYTASAGHLHSPHGDLMAIADLPRALPHDISNSLAAAATALESGATTTGVRDALVAFRGLHHRVEPVGEWQDVQWFDDSKATTPHAVLAAVGGFASVVLLAGGRNKGVDLGALAAAAPHLRAVVALGEAADEVVAAFAPTGLPVVTAGDMDEAVRAAAGLARPGDAVVLSPGCASFDWYPGYAARGDDFARLVRLLHGPATLPDAPEASP
jgi:UDP-N-acetylmuramoylalanine--D-glutamate ligase